MRLVTDITGAVVWSERYKPFGSEAEQSGSVSNDYRFTGKAWDAEAQLFYFNARWQDPDTGRFISEDPLWGNILDPQSLNRFAYGRNNPFRYKDPTGRFNNDVSIANNYPNAARYIEYGMYVGGQKEYDSFEKYGQANKKAVDEAFSPKKGPTVRAEDLKGAYGEFQPNTGSQELSIDKSLLENFENRKPGSRKLLDATIKHELTHFFDDQDGIDYKGEEGELFEFGSYGEVVTGSNAERMEQTEFDDLVDSLLDSWD